MFTVSSSPGPSPGALAAAGAAFFKSLIAKLATVQSRGSLNPYFSSFLPVLPTGRGDGDRGQRGPRGCAAALYSSNLLVCLPPKYGSVP